jgi:hypothetical protein
VAFLFLLVFQRKTALQYTYYSIYFFGLQAVNEKADFSITTTTVLAKTRTVVVKK